MSKTIDPTIQKIVEKITAYDIMYDQIRMVDPIKKQVLTFENNIWHIEDNFCYDAFGENTICKNCISIRSLNTDITTIKTQFVKEKLHMITAVPVKFEGKNIVFELFKDISESEGLIQEQLKSMQTLITKTNELLITDALTGIYNRRFIDERLPVDFAQAQTLNIESYILMIDIDYFKRVNDQFGHLVGDRILKEVAKMIKLVFSNTDMISRFGGEEFLLFVSSSKKDVLERAETLRSKIENMPFTYDDKIIYITISTGIYRVLQDSPNEAIKKADKQLYNAKNTGRNKVCFE